MLEAGRIKRRTKNIIARSSYYPRGKGTKGRSCSYKNIDSEEGFCGFRAHTRVSIAGCGRGLIKLVLCTLREDGYWNHLLLKRC